MAVGGTDRAHMTRNTGCTEDQKRKKRTLPLLLNQNQRCDCSA